MTTPPQDPMSQIQAPLKATPLNALHKAMGGKMVPFAGYEMPVQYPAGVLKEHLHTREAAGLFDVSHMGQVIVEGSNVADALETLMPGDIEGLLPSRIRYSLLLNDAGGIIDDLMITRPADGRKDRLTMVINASGREIDLVHMRDRLKGKATLTLREDLALLALQGPKAAGVLARFCPQAASMGFMTAAELAVKGIPCALSRSGYTGEDGYEISLPADRAVELADALLAEREVLPIGLGARDSLRLEAGLCLYGHDIDTTTTPIEANLTWTIGKRRKIEKNFPGAEKIMDQLFHGAPRLRVGIRPDDRAPAREGTPVLAPDGRAIGTVTSGGFGPSVNAPIAMAYVEPGFAADGTAIQLQVRGTARPARISPMPFTPHRYFRGK